MSDFPDLSRIGNPNPIDFAAYSAACKADPAKWAPIVAIKATEGLSFIDPDFVARIQSAHAAGLAVIPYHFFDPQVDPVAQVAFFVKVTASYMKPGDQRAGDIEWAAGSTQWQPGGQQACLNALSALGEPFQAYVPEGWVTGGTVHAVPHLPGWWEPAYGTNTPPASAAPGLAAWQYTDQGTMPGYTGNVDLSHIENPAAFPLPSGEFTMDQAATDAFAAVNTEIANLATKIDNLYTIVEDGAVKSPGHVGLRDLAAAIAALPSNLPPVTSGMTAAQIQSTVQEAIATALPADLGAELKKMGASA